LDVTGAEYPQTYNDEQINPFDGVSLLPLINESEVLREKPLFWQWQNGKAIRKGKWKLVSDNKGPWELYNMETDQTETHDLIDQFPDVAIQLESDWENWINAGSIN